MMLPLSEPVPLAPGAPLRLERVERAADLPPPARFAHFHGPAELVLIEQGRGTFACDDRAFALAPGMAVFAPAMAVHDFAFEPGPLAWTLIQFDPLALPPGPVAVPATPRAVLPDPASAARLALIAQWLAGSLAQGADHGVLVLQMQALLLAFAQSPGQPAQTGMTIPVALARFRPLLDRIDRAPDQMFTLAQAASLCAMSPAHFSRVFARTFGTGFNAYQTRLKLLLAARYLASGHAGVAQVAWACGFRSHAYFSQCFRALFGTSPSHYRRSGQSHA